MCIGGGPSAPPTPDKLPEAPTPPSEGSNNRNRDKQKRRQAAKSTILSGARGVDSSGTAIQQKTLLGK